MSLNLEESKKDDVVIYDSKTGELKQLNVRLDDNVSYILKNIGDVEDSCLKLTHEFHKAKSLLNFVIKYVVKSEKNKEEEKDETVGISGKKAELLKEVEDKMNELLGIFDNNIKDSIKKIREIKDELIMYVKFK